MLFAPHVHCRRNSGDDKCKVCHPRRGHVNIHEAHSASLHHVFIGEEEPQQREEHHAQENKKSEPS